MTEEQGFESSTSKVSISNATCLSLLGVFVATMLFKVRGILLNLDLINT
jgi:hypothetical protein